MAKKILITGSGGCFKAACEIIQKLQESNVELVVYSEGGLVGDPKPLKPECFELAQKVYTPPVTRRERRKLKS